MHTTENNTMPTTTTTTLTTVTTTSLLLYLFTLIKIIKIIKYCNLEDDRTLIVVGIHMTVDVTPGSLHKG